MGYQGLVEPGFNGRNPSAKPTKELKEHGKYLALILPVVKKEKNAFFWIEVLFLMWVKYCNL